MDLCSIPLQIEELKCPVCLDVFIDPVSTPCGHNFCKSCLKQCWDNSQDCKCPYCKETFSERPELKSNTVLREIVQLFEKNRTAQLCVSGPLSEELHCSICLDLFSDPVTTPCGHNFCKACLKECWESSHDNTCPCCKENFTKRVDLRHCEHLLSQSEILMWQSSYLETHEKVINIKQVMMLDLVEDINPKIIQKYNRALEMFCGDDQTSLCQSCTEGDHKTHNTVHAEDKSKEKKTQEMIVQQMIQDTMKIDQEMKHSEIKMSKKNEEKEKADNIELCADLNYSIEKCQMTLFEH